MSLIIHMNKIDYIKLISSVLETNTNLPQVVFRYLDYVVDSNYISKESISEIKSEIRELSIDLINDDNPFESKDNKYQLDIQDQIIDNIRIKKEKVLEYDLKKGKQNAVGLTVLSKNISLSKSYDEDKIIDEILNLYKTESLKNYFICKKSSHIGTGIDLNLTLTRSDGIDKNSRRLVSKTVICSNYIATSGRIGPANVCLAGSEVYNLLLESSVIPDAYTSKEDGIINLFGLYTINDPNIDPNRCIILRKPNSTQTTGVHLVKNSNNMYDVIMLGNTNSISFEINYI